MSSRSSVMLAAWLGSCAISGWGQAQLVLNPQNLPNSCWAAAGAMVKGKGECEVGAPYLPKCRCSALGEDALPGRENDCNQPTPFDATTDFLPTLLAATRTATQNANISLKGKPSIEAIQRHAPLLVWYKYKAACSTTGHIVVVDSHGSSSSTVTVLDPKPERIGATTLQTCSMVGGGSLGLGHCAYYHDLGSGAQTTSATNALWDNDCQAITGSRAEVHRRVREILRSTVARQRLGLDQTTGVVSCRNEIEMPLHVVDDRGVVSSGIVVWQCSQGPDRLLIGVAPGKGDVFELLWIGAREWIPVLDRARIALEARMAEGQLTLRSNPALGQIGLLQGAFAVQFGDPDDALPLESPAVLRWLGSAISPSEVPDRAWGAPFDD